MQSLVTASVVLCCACSGQPAESGTAPVYLLAGQSNATGGGDGTGIDPIDGTRYRYRIHNGDGSNLREGSGTPVQPRETARGPRFGPEIGFATQTPGATVLKFAVNGTGIQRWVPGGDLHAEWMAWIEDEPVSGLLWVQGTANATSTGDEYRGHLGELAAAFDVPIALVQLHADADRPQADLVRAAQQSFADAAGACLVSIDDLSLKDDAIHWATETQLEAGRRLAACF